MMTKEIFEENAQELIAENGGFDTSEDVIRHVYGDDAPKQFKSFVEAQGWKMAPNFKSKTIRVERASPVG